MTWLLKAKKAWNSARCLPDAKGSIKGGATILVYYCAQLGAKELIARSRKTLIGYFNAGSLGVNGTNSDGISLE
ncbi:hypothetical protein [Marivita sp. XM-24bin2]|uniref:hypothetical protein n=1 Tax=unclassified Marivita TaxID=2632480 RepID=UPI0025B92102|nr:hypothetical protein [Marivita sp. XM-24bin2]MCR9108006.1 hypothetical protein [Paracoccaceae bacterium]